MKITTLLLVVCTATMIANTSYSQSAKVSLNMKNANMRDVFAEIEKQSEFRFFYNEDQLDLSKRVSVLSSQDQISSVLNNLFADTDIAYKVIDKHIVLISMRAYKDAMDLKVAQRQKVTGTIVDGSTGEAIPGVNIIIEGTTLGTVSDLDGKFSIDVPGQDAVLVFSSIGYLSEKIMVGTQTNLDIKLSPDITKLEEVVVIGYGTTTRKNVIGAVDQVKDELIKDRPVANVSQALQGASPNLVIQQRSMNPNDNTMNINIRGITSMNNNDPLIVVDGMILDDLKGMNMLNPNDIESISVLKDAGSAAIYGSRSANGVILITTKKGRLDMKPVVTLNASVGTQNPDILLKPLKGYQNALLRNDSYVNAGLNPIYSSQDIANFAKGDSEWGLKAIMRNALQQNYNLGIQGGSKTTSYHVSFGYYNQESNFKGQDFGVDRYNFRGNIVTQISRLKLTTLLSYDRSEGRSNPFIWLADVMRVPTYNTYDIYPDENGKFYNNEITNGGNTLATLYHGGITTNDDDHFQGVVTGEFDIWKGLKARAVVGYDLRGEHRLIKNRYYPVYDYINRDIITNSGSSTEFHIEDYNGKIIMMNTQFLLDYDRTFADVHKVTALFGFTNESFHRERNEIKRRYVDPDLYQNTDKTIYDKSSYNTPNGTAERGLYSWLGRVGYSYMDKYYFEASGRYDGSSRFAKSQRWGFFPSATLGWRITEEDFFSFWKDKIGDLKLRGSYGLLGSQAVDDYQYLTTYNIYTNQYGFNNSAVTGTGYTFGNSLLTWEKTSTFDFGADATFFNNKLTVSYDFFNKYTKDILLTPQTPSTLGGAVSKANIGEMRNLGWELSINYRLKHADFSHNFGFNIGDAFNKVMKYGDQNISKSDEIERIIREGVPLYSYYGYKTDGLFQNYEEIKNSALPVGAKVEPGDVKYVDRNGDGTIDDNDRYILGNAFPRYTFGFNYSLDWKGLDFSMLWQGVGKRDMALRGEMIEPFHGSYYYVMFEHQLDYWRPDNTDAKYSRLVNSASPSYSNNYSMGSDRNIYDAAYLRLKNIQLGYTIPANLTKKAGINKFRIYVTGQNLLTFSKNSFIDPESSEFGNSMNAGGANSGRNYPTLKYYGGGIEVEF
jgi:TonB-linked SusC/RagA family outer membrane protein